MHRLPQTALPRGVSICLGGSVCQRWEVGLTGQGLFVCDGRDKVGVCLSVCHGGQEVCPGCGGCLFATGGKSSVRKGLGTGRSVRDGSPRSWRATGGRSVRTGGKVHQSRVGGIYRSGLGAVHLSSPELGCTARAPRTCGTPPPPQGSPQPRRTREAEEVGAVPGLPQGLHEPAALRALPGSVHALQRDQRPAPRRHGRVRPPRRAAPPLPPRPPMPARPAPPLMNMQRERPRRPMGGARAVNTG